MIIVSQNKNNAVNFDNVGNINIEKCYNESLEWQDFTYDILVYIISSGLVRLGKYKTEERAKEVLQEIVDTYTRKKYINKSIEKQPILDDLVYKVPTDSNIKFIETDIVYEMPED